MQYSNVLTYISVDGSTSIQQLLFANRKLEIFIHKIMQYSFYNYNVFAIYLINCRVSLFN